LAEYNAKYQNFMKREEKFFMEIMDNPFVMEQLKERLERTKNSEKGELSEGQGNTAP